MQMVSIRSVMLRNKTLFEAISHKIAIALEVATQNKAVLFQTSGDVRGIKG